MLTFCAVSAADDVTVTIDGNLIEFDTAPTIINGRTLVPIRKIFDTLGMNVTWNETDRSVTAESEKNLIRMQIGNFEMTANGEVIVLDVAPTIINNRTLVPVRAVSAASGYTVDWNSENRVVVIEKIRTGHDDKLEDALFKKLSASSYYSPFYSGYANVHITDGNKIAAHPWPSIDKEKNHNFENAVSVNGDPGIMTILRTDGSVTVCVDPSYSVANYFFYNYNNFHRVIVRGKYSAIASYPKADDNVDFIYSGEKINGMDNIVYVTSGKSHVIALKNDGTVLTWGSNFFGQLGNNTTEDSYETAVTVEGIKNITYIEANNNVSYAVDVNGDVYAWGRLSSYSLGGQMEKDSLIPVKIKGLSGIKKIASSGRDFKSYGTYNIALDKNGELWLWGRLDAQNYKTPTKIETISDVKDVSCSSNQIMVLKNDGTLWAAKTEKLFIDEEFYQLNKSDEHTIHYIRAYDSALYFVSDNAHIYGYKLNSNDDRFVGDLEYDRLIQYDSLYPLLIDSNTPKGTVTLPKN